MQLAATRTSCACELSELWVGLVESFAASLQSTLSPWDPSALSSAACHSLCGLGILKIVPGRGGRAQGLSRLAFY